MNKNSLIRFLCGFFLLHLTIACGSSVEVSENPELVYTQVAQTIIAEYTQSAKNITPVETAEPEPTQAPEFGTREAPVPFGQPLVLVYDESVNFEIRVIDIIRGDQAWQMIFAENQFNDPPAAGMEYMLINIGISYLTSTQSDILMEFDSFDFKSVSNNQLFSIQTTIIPSELNISLFPGGYGEGRVALLTYLDDPSPLLVFEKFLSDKMFYFYVQ